MIRYLVIIICLLARSTSYSQSIEISGCLKDSLTEQPLPGASITVFRPVSYEIVKTLRSDSLGAFVIKALPVDTYYVHVSFPNFRSRIFLISGGRKNALSSPGTIFLQSAVVQLEEVEMIAYHEKMYYRGDTLNFAADSFHKPGNGTVEDLLRNLNGVAVQGDGKVTVQGKAIKKVLVDGDEFFGIDPRIATQNLQGDMVETVQVYQQKNKNGSHTGNEETVINLRLKEDSKKGSFGKAAAAYCPKAATDLKTPLCEGNGFLNHFNRKQKFSLFASYANTPKEASGAHESNEFDNGQSSAGSYSSINRSNPGIPETFKSGLTCTNKFGKGTTLNTQYTYQKNRLVSQTETNNRFYLSDTSYSSTQSLHRTTDAQNHNFQFNWNQKIGSSATLIVNPQLNYYTSVFDYRQEDRYISGSNEQTRSTDQLNVGNSEVLDASLAMKLMKDFLKKGRSLQLSYAGSNLRSAKNNRMHTGFRYQEHLLADSVLQQNRQQHFGKTAHSLTALYTEPLGKQWKVEVLYAGSTDVSVNDRITVNQSDVAPDIIDPALTNRFLSDRSSQSAGVKLMYDASSYKVNVGTEYKSIHQKNVNASAGLTQRSRFNNMLPYAGVSYDLSQAARLSVDYYGEVLPPSLQQMQPLADNSDPNNIYIGNPGLKTQFQNNVICNYSAYKLETNSSVYATAAFNSRANEITERTTYDSLGRSLSTPVNINGNYHCNLDVGGNKALNKQWMKINYDLNAGFSQTMLLVNNDLAPAKVFEIRPRLSWSGKNGWLDWNLGGDYNYSVVRQSLSTATIVPYYSYNLNFDLRLRMPEGFTMGSNGNYVHNGKRSNGYNTACFILNAAIAKNFGKREGLVFSIEAYDLLAQNINSYRYVQANRITDTKTTLIQRYFLVRLLYKFSRTKRSGH